MFRRLCLHAPGNVTGRSEICNLFVFRGGRGAMLQDWFRWVVREPLCFSAQRVNSKALQMAHRGVQ
jgi:hypothetical protein